MGGANNTKIKLTAIDNLRCRIEADIDGVGGYDWDSGILYWSDFEPYRGTEIVNSYVQYRTFSDPATPWSTESYR
jgi:hypothetical protein